MINIGIDVGGTFTDFVVEKEGSPPLYFKTASTPGDQSIGVMQGLEDVADSLGFSVSTLLDKTSLIIHGTTVATNTLIEKKGAKVGLITTEGFRDLLEIREGFKEDRYNLRMDPVDPLVPRYLRHAVDERVRRSGEIQTPIDEAELERVVDTLIEEGVTSIAVCFIFSYLNPSHESVVSDLIEKKCPGIYHTSSYHVLPQIKEYDRLSTTVVNAYVGPVYSRYLSHMKTQFEDKGFDKEILTMKSNGGVSAIEDATRMAVHAILSGPAGGVAGAAAYGRMVGEENLIGFDMGGTSTDISLIERGDPHITTDRYEAGWKIAAPMIDIHTLGAGGGSVGYVDDGGTLHVGPQSAGATPGPASYGLGGTDPTVTDANVVLGFLSPNNFLGGRKVLESSLAEQAIQDRIATPLGLPMDAAAYGMVQVVNTTMAEGIRLLSVRRGIDPRKFALLAFGGAAGIHVCQVARQLQIRKVYLPAPAPVLSAFGLLKTDLKYDYSRSYISSLDRVDLDQVRRITQEMAEEGKKKLRSQRLEEHEIGVLVSADMRYLDQVYEVRVPVPNLEMPVEKILTDWAVNFHNRYKELYSYSQVDQEIRLVTLRVSVVGRNRFSILPEKQSDGAHPEKGFRSVFLGERLEIPVYDTGKLSSGYEIIGPAILESEYTTILIEKSDRVTVDTYGGMVIDIRDSESRPGDDSDPIMRSLVEHRLESIAREMAEVMIRTSMSQILNSSRDFSTAILDADCQLVAQGEGIPVHISALPPAVEAILNCFGDDITEGDLYVVNDPYFGGSHLPDITAIYPVFHDGALRFFTVNRAHHSDIGGATHGAYNPSASEIFHEGLRIPPLKLYDAGRPRDDVLRMLAVNVRHSENFKGDLTAQIGSVMIAARRLNKLLSDYGAVGLMGCVVDILNGTEKLVRNLIRSWPDGVYQGETFIDDDGFDAVTIPIRAEVTIQDDTMTVDLSQSNQQVTGFINSAYANTRSLAHVGIMYMAPSDIPKNEGSMRPITVVAPKGLIVNPNPPAPVCMSTNHCGEEIVEAIFKALAPIVPHAVNAGFSRRLRFAITGKNPVSGRPYIWHFFFGRGGGGASEGHDGWSCVGEVNVAGAIRSPSVEITEERFPFHIVRNDFRPDSGGDGQWRGGMGAIFEMIYEGTEPAKLNTAGDGAVNAPFGLFGGSDGLPHRYSIISDGKERVLRTKETEVIVLPGDLIRCLSSGGGGYGDPVRRSAVQRDHDIKNGLTNTSKL